jgi:hypothetical protein
VLEQLIMILKWRVQIPALLALGENSGEMQKGLKLEETVRMALPLNTGRKI